MSLTIPPTIGRRVLVFSAGTAGVNNSKVPFDAGIAYVHSEGKATKEDPLGQASMINVGYRDHNGVAVAMGSVRLYDRAQREDDAHGKEWYAVWMPFQFEQAVRAQSPNKTPSRPADVQMVKLEENGVMTEAGLQRQAEIAAAGSSQEEAVLGEPAEGSGPQAEEQA